MLIATSSFGGIGMGVDVSEEGREGERRWCQQLFGAAAGLRTTLGVVMEDKQGVWRVDVA